MLVMRIMEGQRLQGDLLQDIVFLWEEIWSLGKARSRMWFLGPVQKLSIEPWLSQYKRLYGFIS